MSRTPISSIYDTLLYLTFLTPHEQESIPAGNHYALRDRVSTKLVAIINQNDLYDEYGNRFEVDVENLS